MRQSRVASPESALKTFTVRTVRHETFRLQAEYVTRGSSLNAPVYFWVRGAHWYSRRRCVGVVEWQLVLTVAVEAETNTADLAHQLGVKI